jgi:thiol:disulfide interchange protein DsbA
MRRILYYTLLPVLLFVTSLLIISYGTHATASSQGYKEITPVMKEYVIPGKVTVTEFFSYGCPSCYMVEPQLEQWLSKHNTVVFQRVPSVFRSEWVIYAKAYYVAKHFGISEKITPAFFKAVQEKGKDLSTPEQVANFFVQTGIDKKQFQEVFNFSPAIDGQVSHADQLFHQYQIFAIPTFVVNGRYLTNADITGGSNQKLFEVLSALVTKPSNV